MLGLVSALSAVLIVWVGIWWVGNGLWVGIGTGVGKSFMLWLGGSAWNCFSRIFWAFVVILVGNVVGNGVGTASCVGLRVGNSFCCFWICFCGKFFFFFISAWFLVLAGNLVGKEVGNRVGNGVGFLGFGFGTWARVGNSWFGFGLGLVCFLLLLLVICMPKSHTSMSL